MKVYPVITDGHFFVRRVWQGGGIGAVSIRVEDEMDLSELRATIESALNALEYAPKPELVHDSYTGITTSVFQEMS